MDRVSDFFSLGSKLCRVGTRYIFWEVYYTALYSQYQQDFVKKKTKYFKLQQVDEVCSENDELNERAEGWDRSE